MRLSNSYPNCAESIITGLLEGGGWLRGRVNLKWLVIVENFAPVGDVEIQKESDRRYFFLRIKKTPSGKRTE